jgi:hypothetical protein
MKGYTLIFNEDFNETVSPKYGKFVVNSSKNTNDTLALFINNSGKRCMVFLERYSGYMLTRD